MSGMLDVLVVGGFKDGVGEFYSQEVFDVLGILEASNTGVIMRGSMEDLNWLARQISIFSFDFVVREPEELKDELQKHSRKLTKISGAL